MSNDRPAEDENGSLRRLIAECRSNAEAWDIARTYVKHPLDVHGHPVTATDDEKSAARLQGALRIAETGLLRRNLATTAVLVESARAARAIAPAATGVQACEETRAALTDLVKRAAMVRALRAADAHGTGGADVIAADLETAPDRLAVTIQGVGEYFESLADPPLLRYLLTRGTPLFPKYLFEEKADTSAP